MSTIHKAICIFKNLTVKACRHLYSYENKHMSGSKSNDNPHVKQPLKMFSLFCIARFIFVLLKNIFHMIFFLNKINYNSWSFLRGASGDKNLKINFMWHYFLLKSYRNLINIHKLVKC